MHRPPPTSPIPLHPPQGDLAALAAELRARRGPLSIEAIAKAWRISPQTYRQIELGRQRPQIRTCYKLAGFLGRMPEAVLRLAGYTAGLHAGE